MVYVFGDCEVARRSASSYAVRAVTTDRTPSVRADRAGSDAPVIACYLGRCDWVAGS